MEKKNSFLVGSEEWIEEDNLYEENRKKYFDKIKLFLKKYLLLDNVNFLFDTGSSLHLGAESIQGIPKQISDGINSSGYNEIFLYLKGKYEEKKVSEIKEILKQEEKDFFIWEDKRNSLTGKLKEEINKKIDEDKIKVTNDKISLKNILNEVNEEEKEEIYKLGVEIKLEDFLNYLFAIKYLMEKSEGLIIDEILKYEELEGLILTIKRSLFKLCDIDKIKLDDNIFLKKVDTEKIKKIMEDEGKYTYHKSFLTSLLQRPLNLRRANIFTLNYDLAFEYACDELAIQYINGFVGFNERNFRPEVYNYDFFYPGDTTEGKVRRIERVIKYYKLHGSLNWVHKKESKNNPYGLYEIPIDLVRLKLELNKSKELGDIMIYPTSSKKEYTLNFPYSELFRKFADRLQQPEAVLFVVGYSFYDEHINDIIYQALANPSFTLIIIDYYGSKNGGEILRLENLKDPRIIISQGPELGDFKIFAKELLPTMEQEDTRRKVMASLEALFSNEKNQGDEECLVGKSEE